MPPKAVTGADEDVKFLLTVIKQMTGAVSAHNPYRKRPLTNTASDRLAGRDRRAQPSVQGRRVSLSSTLSCTVARLADLTPALSVTRVSQRSTTSLSRASLPAPPRALTRMLRRLQRSPRRPRRRRRPLLRKSARCRKTRKLMMLGTTSRLRMTTNELLLDEIDMRATRTVLDLLIQIASKSSINLIQRVAKSPWRVGCLRFSEFIN
jgi:hypothetical protein